jgi:hypothetical protein
LEARFAELGPRTGCYKSGVAKFVSGFGLASVLWLLAGAGLVFGLGWGPPAPAPEPLEEVAAVEVPDAPEAPARRRARRSRSGTEPDRGHSAPTGEATTGDDLGEDEMRTIDGEGTGGEAQLTSSQIEAAFDGAMPRIRRCFLLAAGDEPVRGRLTFGLRIRGSGEVAAVNLSGPAAVTSGECGDCLRTAARGIRFPVFDGPEMVARFPITLE